jgi:hypothetical protein
MAKISKRAAEIWEAAVVAAERNDEEAFIALCAGMRRNARKRQRRGEADVPAAKPGARAPLMSYYDPLEFGLRRLY